MIPDERTLRAFGVHSVVYLRSLDANGEGGYEVRFSDGRTLRVGPESGGTTRKRLHALQGSLEALTAGVPDPVTYVKGALAEAGLTWMEG